jgi:hypothetical protein
MLQQANREIWIADRRFLSPACQQPKACYSEESAERGLNDAP